MQHHLLVLISSLTAWKLRKLRCKGPFSLVWSGTLITYDFIVNFIAVVTCLNLMHASIWTWQDINLRCEVTLSWLTLAVIGRHGSHKRVDGLTVCLPDIVGFICLFEILILFQVRSGVIRFAVLGFACTAKSNIVRWGGESAWSRVDWALSAFITAEINFYVLILRGVFFIYNLLLICDINVTRLLTSLID